jgi:CheY-like chemotaxis protein
VKRLILLADDSPTIQRLVTQMFVGGEFDVVSVSNGDAAVRKFEEIHPDLVLADIYMPGKNGYEVCAAIKKHPELGDTPVVLLAGAFDAFDEGTANQAGAAAHITKPFEPQALLSLVSSLAPKVSGRRPAVERAAPEEKIAPLPPPAIAPPTISEPEPAPVPPMEPALERLTLVSSEPPAPSLEPLQADPARVAAPTAYGLIPPKVDTPPIDPPAENVPEKVHEKPALADGGDLLGLQDLFKPAPTSTTVSDAEIDRIADRVIKKRVAWDVVPEITAKVLREELKRQS